MLIHTDTMHHRELHASLFDAQLAGPMGGVWIEDIELSGSRKRDHKFKVSLAADPAPGRQRRRNVGHRGAEFAGETPVWVAATWLEWGWWIACMFRYEPTAIIGQYDGRADFLAQTAAMRYRGRHDLAIRAAFDKVPEGTSPFADLTHLPPVRLVNLADPQQVDRWLTS